MKRKRSLADSVLWPPEGNENEVHALYDAIISADVAAETEGTQTESLKLFDRPDLHVEELDDTTLRVRPKGGGASVVVSLQENVLSSGVLHPEIDAAASWLRIRQRHRARAG